MKKSKKMNWIKLVGREIEQNLGKKVFLIIIVKEMEKDQKQSKRRRRKNSKNFLVINSGKSNNQR